MPRGRKRDPTLPPSRSLLTQRAFRERKAQYVSDLEQRCKVAEAENERLKIELEELRTRLQTLESARREGSKDGVGGSLEQNLESRLRDDMALASVDLLSTLTIAASSIAHFQDVLKKFDTSGQRNGEHCDSTPQGSTLNGASPEETSKESTSDDTGIGSTNLGVLGSTNPAEDDECCGGLFDCSGVADSE